MHSPGGLGRAARLGLWLRAVPLLVTPALATAGEDTDSTKLALRLRQGPGLVNHPVGVVPSDEVLVPGSMPLATDGSITCFTCHTQIPSLEGARQAYLRDHDEQSEGGTLAFCRKCHAKGSGGSPTSMHWTVVGRAHIPAEVNRSTAGGLVDADSRRCMACHDGVSAAELNNPTPGSAQPPSIGDSRHSHPVGVVYPRAPRPGDAVRLRAALLLPAQVRLADGKVSCVSCHNLYAKDPARLAVPIEGSQLCFTCHDMD